MECDSDLDSVVSWNVGTPIALSPTSTPGSVVQWTPPVGQEQSSEQSIVPWSTCDSPTISVSPLSNAIGDSSIAIKTPSRPIKLTPTSNFD